MELQVAAKGTKPGNKSSMGATRTSNGTTARVPVGTLHYVDLDAQSTANSMHEGLCGESHLVAIDDEWDSKIPNDRCEACADLQWQASFAEEQSRLLK